MAGAAGGTNDGVDNRCNGGGPCVGGKSFNDLGVSKNGVVPF